MSTDVAGAVIYVHGGVKFYRGAARAARSYVERELPELIAREFPADADLVIEAATEREDIKNKIFESVVPHLRPETILTSNTSSISITRLASRTDRPEKFMGFHFMNPESYEQVAVPEDVIGDQAAYLQESVVIGYVDNHGATGERVVDPRRLDGGRLPREPPEARAVAGLVLVGALDQLALLRSSSLGELLETTTRLTSEALELLPLQSPDEPDGPA